MPRMWFEPGASPTSSHDDGALTDVINAYDDSGRTTPRAVLHAEQNATLTFVVGSPSRRAGINISVKVSSSGA